MTKTFFYGLLGETLIYNRLLTESEIHGLYTDFLNTRKATTDLTRVNLYKHQTEIHTNNLQGWEVDHTNMNFSSSALDSLDNLMWNKVHSHTLAGVEYLIADKSRVIHHQAVGYRDLDKLDTLQKNSLFRIACTSRPFTVVSVLMLARRDYWH